MTYKPDYQATLAYFDEREAEIKRTLPYLKTTLKAREYRQIEVAYAREVKQMDARREILQKFIRQEILEDIKETLSACGVLVQSSEPTEDTR
jgi:hypothetical protein